jgi:hypothetical protein
MPDIGLNITFSLLSIILGQAAIILIACSMLLVVVKDLNELRVVSAGLPNQRKKKEYQPVLSTRCADRLRVFIYLFSMLLPASYLFIGFCVILVERSRSIINGKRIAEIRSPISIWDFSYSFGLQEVYEAETIFHFGVVVIVAFIFFWMTGVRREVTKERLRERPS